MENKNTVRLLIIAFFLLITIYLSSRLLDIMKQTQAYDNFIPADRAEEISFEKLVGKYELDILSKKKYNLNINSSLMLEVKKDSSFIATNYIDNKTGKLILNNKKGYIYT